MNSKKIFFVMLGFVALLVLALIGLTIYGTSLLERRSESLNELKIENRVLEEQQAALFQAKKDIERYSDIEQIARAVVPQDKDQARAVREVVQLASENGINLNSITFPASTLGDTPPAPPSRTQNDESEEDDDTEQPQQPARPPLSQAQPVPGISGVYSLEMVVSPSVSVSYYQFLEFLSRLENNRRTAQVTRISITPVTRDADNPQINFSLTINIFVKP